MFKRTIRLILIVLLLARYSHEIQVQPSTYCIGNCHSCPALPQQCPYMQSIPFPNQNHNCLPFSVGDNCTSFADGFQLVYQDALNGWSSSNNNSNPNASPQSCTLFHVNANAAKFQALGPFDAGTNITKNITINRDIIDVIILKAAFTIKAANIFRNKTTTSATDNPPAANPDDQNAPTVNPDGTIDPATQQGSRTQGVNNSVSNQTNRTFVSVRISGAQFSYILNLNYPTTPTNMSSIVNSTCGIHLQYVHQHSLTSTLNNLDRTSIKIDIESIGAENTSWGLVKLQLMVGCGNFMISTGTSKCSTCVSGYYPVRSAQNLLLGCELCPLTCLACNQDGCTLCQSYTQLNPKTYQCQYSRLYTNITNYRIVEGESIEYQNNKYFYTLLSPSTTTNNFTLQAQLESPAPYAIMFYLLYSNDFIQGLAGRSVTILQGYKTLLTIPASEFRTDLGFYDSRLLGGIRKFYIKNIFIDQMNVENLQKNLTITVSIPANTRNIFLANYQVVQYQCSPRCSQCDRATNLCIQCNSFFVNRGSTSCIVCANGFYLQKNYNNTKSNTSLQLLSPDICLKCYSSCKQCVGAQIDKCMQCFDLFHLQRITYNKQCISCIYNAKTKPSQTIPTQCNRCMNMFTTDVIFNNAECANCIANATLSDVMGGEMCKSCWIKNGLAYGRCIPTPQAGLSFYGADISNGIIDDASWTSSNKIEKLNCSSNYHNIYGIANTNLDTNSSIKWATRNLPTHTGLYIVLNIFKTDITSTLVSGVRKNQNLYINTGDNKVYTVELVNKRSGTSSITPGSNVCNNDNNQMIYTFTYNLAKHTGADYNIEISSEGGGIYVRQLQLYLGNCDSCANYQLNYQVNWLPRYVYNTSSSSGLDLWIQFNEPVQVPPNTDLKNAFKFNIDQLPNIKFDDIQFHNQLALNNRLHYYLPIQESFINATLTVSATPNANLFGINSNSLKTARRLLVYQQYIQKINNNEDQYVGSQMHQYNNKIAENSRLLLNSPLNVLVSSQPINRYSKLSADDLISTGQIYQFYNFFQWFALITMIVCIFLGIGIIFQEFSIMLQLLFLHVYISSTLLPATYKAPMYGLHRMQHLNYFADPHAQSIEWQWFQDYEHPSPFVFQQYNKDILFERSFYPTIIINLMYLVWFIILLIVYKVVPRFQTSTSTIVGFFRNIPARPLNFIDQIWRYQFITTMWAAFMQFHILKNDTAWQRVNLALCFISFIISILWPFFVVFFTYRMNKVKYSTQFMYKYEDIYFKKMETISEDKFKYYNYIFIRFLRYLVIVLFINVFTDHEIIAPVILICANVIQIIYVVALRIFYNSVLGAVFKVAENLLFIAIQVALLFVYGLSDNASDSDFLNLGYALNVLYVITIIIGLLRIGYYAYQKFKHMKYNMKFGIDNGEVVKIGPTPLPTTDRYDAPSNAHL